MLELDAIAAVMRQPPGVPDVALADLVERPAWHAHAACRGHDPALWFPQRGADTSAAKAVCAGCAVRAECGDFAAEVGVTLHGIWAGLSARQRRQLRLPAA